MRHLSERLRHISQRSRHRGSRVRHMGDVVLINRGNPTFSNVMIRDQVDVVVSGTGWADVKVDLEKGAPDCLEGLEKLVGG